MLILDRQRWLTQPEYPTEVDHTHPLASSLAGFFYPAGGHWWDALLGRTASSDDSTASLDSRVSGYARDYSNQQAQFAHAPDYALIGNEGMTVAVMLDADALTNTGHLVSKGTNDAGSPWYLRLGVTGGDNSQIDFSRGDNSSAYMRYRTGASDMFSAPASDVLVAVTCAGNNMYYDPPTIWVDDVATVKTVGSYWTFGGSGVTDVADGGGTLYIGKNSAGTSYLDGRIKRIALANRPWTQDELREFRFAPYALLRKRRTPTFYSASSGTTYNETVTESITLTDTVSVAATAAPTVTESLSLSDAVTPAVTVNATVTESATLSDTVSAGNVFNDTVTESVTLTDSVAVVLAVAATVTEGLSLADTVTPAVTINSTVTESVTLTDGVTNGNVYADTLTESVSLTDTVSVVVAANPTVTESLALADVLAPSLIVNATVSESVSLTDSVTGALAGSGSFTDADVDLVWDELMDASHSARTIMAAMATFLEQRGLLP